jgi:uncharacterized protein YdaU (DUF1376 family)
MTEERPAPLVESHVDCTDLDGFMLNVERLMASELVAVSSHEVVAAALFLWCRAWKQRPAASLPDDDRILSSFCRLPLHRFRVLKAQVLRGFVKCSDGRLYHRFLSADAVRAFEKKKAHRSRREKDAERLRKWRSGHDETHRETSVESRSETRFVADRNGKDRDRDRDTDRDRDDLREDSPSESPIESSSSRGRKLPSDWRPTDDDWMEACRSLGSRKAEVELAKFRDYWPAKPGGGSRKLNWDATWRNWVRRAAEQLPSGPIAVTSAEPTIDLGGEFREVPTRNLPGIVKLFEAKGAWPYPTPKPGEQGCRVPSTFLPQRLQATGTNGR